jgi:hypothetical protein
MKQNQEHPLLKFKHALLGEKLRQCIDNLVTDVWGLEKKAAESLDHFFKKESLARSLPKESFTIKVNNAPSLLIALFHNNKMQFPISANELLQLLNLPNINSNDLEKIIRRLKQLMTKYADNYKTVDLHLSVRVKDEKVQIHLTDSKEILETITLSELIKHLW